jgi:F-type H+-transporting ATPase subunit b
MLQEKGGRPVLQLNITLFIQIANFLVLLFVLNLVLYRPIRKILSRRKEEMGAFRGMIEGFQQKSADCANKIEEGTAETTKEGLRQKETMKSRGLEEEKNMLRKASSEAAGKMGQARQDLEEKLAALRQSLGKEMALFSREFAEKVLGRSL